MSNANNETEGPSFEEAMERLEQIVSAMEGDRMPLEAMVQSYEEGVRLLRACRERIDAARRRVELITADLESGKASLRPMDTEPEEDEADEDDTKSRKPRRKTDKKSDDIRLL